VGVAAALELVLLVEAPLTALVLLLVLAVVAVCLTTLAAFGVSWLVQYHTLSASAQA
jgi:hypothetical protein